MVWYETPKRSAVSWYVSPSTSARATAVSIGVKPKRSRRAFAREQSASIFGRGVCGLRRGIRNHHLSCRGVCEVSQWLRGFASPELARSAEHPDKTRLWSYSASGPSRRTELELRTLDVFGMKPSFLLTSSSGGSLSLASVTGTPHHQIW